MPATQEASSRRGRHIRSSSRQTASSTTKDCKTCALCRLKKVKCCGTRPQCTECTTDELECVYPQDARREPRPSRTRLKRLEAALASMLDQMKAGGLAPPESQLEDWMSRGGLDDGGNTRVDPTNCIATAPGHVEIDMPSTAGDIDTMGHTTMLLSPPRSSIGSVNPPGAHTGAFQALVFPQKSHTSPSLEMARTDVGPASVGSGVMDENNQDTADCSGLSPGEARIAGIFRQDGCVSSVHGLASMMNQTSSGGNREPAAPMLRNTRTISASAVAVSKARLISYAVLQKQREPLMYIQPRSLADFDGCEPGLARHLIDLHFSIQHYAYLISYRPAIMESIANGGGPWANKLLLNAIYYASCLVSDRPGLQDDPDDPHSIGSRFYNRFCQLLGSEIGKPSIPTAVALLTTSASLVSHGRSTAGWNLSGLAYRMIIDLGCHLTLGPDCEAGNPDADPNGRDTLFHDLDQEMRKRLYWGAFATDVTQSLYLGRPCMFATVEARVPLTYLDTFEELEMWEPHVDPQAPASEQPPAYAPQPAHGVSTFGALIRLFQLCTRILKIYGIDTIKCDTQYLQNEVADIERHLQSWSESLPQHLRFDPERPFVPPPHQITPHTTFHAINILLHRAFLDDGHLCHHSDAALRARSEEACIHSASMIEKFLRRYRDAFTFRGAPFLICYATYSAVVVVLRQERHARGRFTGMISFFWTCLSELQRGCNFGMTKPLAVLKEMVRQYELSMRETGCWGEEGGGGSLQGGLDESCFFFPPLRADQTMDGSGGMPQMATASGGGGEGFVPDVGEGGRMDDFMGGDLASLGFTGYVDEQERTIWQDVLYGLFTTSLPFG